MLSRILHSSWSLISKNLRVCWRFRVLQSLPFSISLLTFIPPSSLEPLFLSCAETDQTFPAESRHIAEKILADNKQSYHFQLFSGVEHGFALRGDMSVENERKELLFCSLFKTESYFTHRMGEGGECERDFEVVREVL